MPCCLIYKNLRVVPCILTNKHLKQKEEDFNESASTVIEVPLFTSGVYKKCQVGWVFLASITILLSAAWCCSDLCALRVVQMSSLEGRRGRSSLCRKGEISSLQSLRQDLSLGTQDCGSPVSPEQKNF